MIFPPELKPETLYPFIVPESYPKSGLPVRSMGNGVQVWLAFRLKNSDRALHPGDLETMKLDYEAASSIAHRNLEALTRTPEFKVSVFENGPSGQPFVMVGKHWAGASAILSSELIGRVSKIIRTEELCASIPHHQTTIFFRMGDRPYRDAMRAWIKSSEGEGGRVLTLGLFEVRAGSVKALEE